MYLRWGTNVMEITRFSITRVGEVYEDATGAEQGSRSITTQVASVVYVLLKARY